MKRLSLIAGSATTTLLVASSIGGNAFAWHPKGVITKSVQNVTAGGAMSDANNASSAVSAKPGDTLRYTIIVSNTGSADNNGYNDMAKTVMTDTLPAGVELISNPSQRQITENLGLIKPGSNVTKTYDVKVTATQNGLIENKACFTGDSTANDNPQAGCDVADVTVMVPVTPPATPVAPVTPPAQPVAQPTTLPSTGTGTTAIVAAVAAGIIGYAVALKRQAR